MLPLDASLYLPPITFHAQASLAQSGSVHSAPPFLRWGTEHCFSFSSLNMAASQGWNLPWLWEMLRYYLLPFLGRAAHFLEMLLGSQIVDIQPEGLALFVSQESRVALAL